MDANKVHKETMSRNERIASYITKKVGSMQMAYIFTAIAFISFPAAILSHQPLIIISWIAQTFLQLVLLPVIIVGQNLQSRHSELRSKADYEADKKSIRILNRIERKLNK